MRESRKLQKQDGGTEQGEVCKAEHRDLVLYKKGKLHLATNWFKWAQCRLSHHNNITD